jgi:hypothetical protein
MVTLRGELERGQEELEGVEGEQKGFDSMANGGNGFSYFQASYHTLIWKDHEYKAVSLSLLPMGHERWEILEQLII